MNNFITHCCMFFFVVVSIDRMHLQFSLLTSKRNINACIAFLLLAAICHLETKGNASSLVSIIVSGDLPTSTSRTEVWHVKTSSVQLFFNGSLCWRHRSSNTIKNSNSLDKKADGSTITKTMMNNILAQIMPLLFSVSSKQQ
jgi:hypothetical protein